MTFRVANIIDTFNATSGGPPGTVCLIAAAGQGLWESDLFTTDHKASSADSLLIDDYPGRVCILPSGSRTTLGGLSMMTGFSKGHRRLLLCGGAPDIMHLHGLWSPYLAAFAQVALRNHIPYIIAPHGMLEPWSLGVRAARKSLALMLYQRRILAGASAIHVTSQMEADNLGRLDIGDAPVFVIPNAVEEATLPPEAQLSTDDRRVLLFLSRLHEKKGVDILLRAWNEIRPAMWRLLIVGSGRPRYVEQLKEFCASQAVPNVEFKAHVDGPMRERVFSEAAAFVLPTYSENFGNVVAEALIRGLPVITTTGTPWTDLVEQGCGWYVEPTVAALKAAIGEVTARDSQTLGQMGARGREYARARFTLPIVRGALLDMYQRTIGRR